MSWRPCWTLSCGSRQPHVIPPVVHPGPPAFFYLLILPSSFRVVLVGLAIDCGAGLVVMW